MIVIMINEEFLDEYGRVVTDKKCLKCHQVKVFDDFNTSKNGKYKRHNYCKICLRAENKKNYEQNRQARIDHVKNWNRRNKNKTRVYVSNYQDKINPGRKKREPKIYIPDSPDIPDLPPKDF